MSMLGRKPLLSMAGVFEDIHRKSKGKIFVNDKRFSFSFPSFYPLVVFTIIVQAGVIRLGH